jgi:hypothetical protein
MVEQRILIFLKLVIVLLQSFESLKQIAFLFTGRSAVGRPHFLHFYAVGFDEVRNASQGLGNVGLYVALCSFDKELAI